MHAFIMQNYLQLFFMILLEGNGTIMFMYNFYSDMFEKKIVQMNSLNYRA